MIEAERLFDDGERGKVYGSKRSSTFACVCDSICRLSSVCSVCRRVSPCARVDQCVSTIRFQSLPCIWLRCSVGKCNYTLLAGVWASLPYLSQEEPWPQASSHSQYQTAEMSPKPMLWFLYQILDPIFWSNQPSDPGVIAGLLLQCCYSCE